MLDPGDVADGDGLTLVGVADDGRVDDGLAGLGERVTRGRVTVGAGDRVMPGDCAGVPSGVPVPGDVEFEDTGLNSMYRASTARNSTDSTIVDVRGRPVMARSRSTGRCRARRTR